MYVPPHLGTSGHSEKVITVELRDHLAVGEL